MRRGRETLALSLLFVVASLTVAEVPRPLPRKPVALPSLKAEFKLCISEENTDRATQTLKLNPQRAVKEVVCFFDTSDGALDANHLILRARQKSGQPGESTVRLRTTAAAADLSDAERSIQPEQDWTTETGPTLSRSVDRTSLAKGLVSKVAAGQAEEDDLFNAVQRQLVALRMKDFPWEHLRRYGPIEAEVWAQQWKLYGFPEAVTVELWHLRWEDRTQDILEVSAKARGQTEAQTQALARQFFAAAKAAGLGEPAGQTKTTLVLVFFKPGR